MTEKDQKFITSWAKTKQNGQVKYFIKIILFTCLVSAFVILFYTWNNIPKGKFLESLAILSILIFAIGILLGAFLGWKFWRQNNNRYKFLTTEYQIAPNIVKQEWFKNDKIWSILTTTIGGIYFILLYTSIFLFDSNPTAIKYVFAGTIFSYFIALFGYEIYRYLIDKQGKTKLFPLFFKVTFCAIILLTVIFGLLVFY